MCLAYEMADVVAGQIVKVAAKSKLPLGTKYKVSLGDLANVFAERRAMAK